MLAERSLAESHSSDEDKDSHPLARSHAAPTSRMAHGEQDDTSGIRSFAPSARGGSALFTNLRAQPSSGRLSRRRLGGAVW